VKAGSLRLGEAGELLELSYRQAKRIWARYRKGGRKACSMATAGKAPTDLIRKSFAKRCWKGEEPLWRFGPTLAANIWGKKTDSACMPRRCGAGWGRPGCGGERGGASPIGSGGNGKRIFGELVQLDGSFHEWLEERGRRGCLMHMVDDATGTVSCQFSAEETIWAAVGVLRVWIEHYGVPRALYTDWRNVYVRARRKRKSGGWNGCMAPIRTGW